jgi:hypothetical protein
MTRKLTIISIVLFAIAIGVIVVNPFNVIRKPITFWDAFPMGDIYGAIETKDLRYFLHQLESDSTFTLASYNPILIGSLLETLTEHGIETKTLYLSADLIKGTFHFLLPVSNLNKAQTYIQEAAYLFDFESDTIEGQPVYSYYGMRISLDKHWLQFIYTNTTIFQVEGNPNVQISPVNPELLNQKNTLNLRGDRFNEFGITSATLNFQPKESSATLAVLFSEPIFNSNPPTEMKQLTAVSEHLHLFISPEWIKRITTQLQQPFQRLKDLGLNEEEILATWSGDLLFQRGMEFELVDTIIITTFDEEFNPVESEKIRRKWHSSYLLFIGSEQPDELLKAMKRNNFIRPSKNIARMPNGDVVKFEKKESGLLFYTLQLPDSLIQYEAPHSQTPLIYFNQSIGIELIGQDSQYIELRLNWIRSKLKQHP